MSDELVTSSPIKSDCGVPNEGFSEDSSTWSLEEVIRFLKSIDPVISGLFANVFRHQKIDGVALLLLKSDVMG